ncbi:endonuclease III [bacterium]|nr:endonuclease III [bacterium]
MVAPIYRIGRRKASRRISAVIDRLNTSYKRHELAEISGSDPFRVLICGILSARAKDTQTAPVCRKLFELADNPASLLVIPKAKLKSIIRPIGFYNQKTDALRKTCRILVENYEGDVPETFEELVKLAGIGRKVANLVLSVAFGKDAICVDTHVHRITNRLGWVESNDVLDTEKQLMALVARRRWRTLNYVFVRHGQECCHPLSPWCSRCPIEKWCAKVAVTRCR